MFWKIQVYRQKTSCQGPALYLPALKLTLLLMLSLTMLSLYLMVSTKWKLLRYFISSHEELKNL